MGRKKDSYKIMVNYPHSNEDLEIMRKNMGAAYAAFVEDYISSLPIDYEEKDRLLGLIMQKLRKVPKTEERRKARNQFDGM